MIGADFVCYVVPSPKLYKEWLEVISNKYNNKVKRVIFTDIKYGYVGVNVKLLLENGDLKKCLAILD